MLVRAAQQLLEDAEEDAQQVSRTLKAAAVTVPAKRAVGRAAGAPAGSNGAVWRSASATVAAAVSVDDLRSSPLGTVLAQYKEAQAVWAQEKVRSAGRAGDPVLRTLWVCAFAATCAQSQFKACACSGCAGFVLQR